MTLSFCFQPVISKPGTAQGIGQYYLPCLDSGLRASELTSLNLSDLELSTGTLEIKKGKGRKPRVTFVGSVTRKAIRQWLKYRSDEAGALFTTLEGERLTDWGLRQICRRRANLAGIA